MPNTDAIRDMAEVRARLDRLPATKFAVKLLLMLVPVWILESYDIGTIGTTVAVVKQLWEPSAFEVGALAVSSTLAIAVGLTQSGRLVDRYGRRAVLLWGVVWFSVTTVIAGLSPNIWFLIIFRFIAGLGLGAVFPLPYVYLAEFMAPRLRARFVGYLNGVLTAAYVLPPLTAIFLLSEFSHEASWRLLHIIAVVGLIYVAVVYKVLPESPRWLVLHERGQEALKIVDEIEKSALAGGHLLETPDIAPAVDRIKGDQASGRRRPATDIFRPPLLRRTIVIWLAFFGTLPLFYVVLAYAPTLLVASGFKLTNSLALVAGLQLLGGLGGLLQGILGDRLGRRPLIAGYGVLSAIGLAILAARGPLFTLIIAGVLVGFFGLGIFPVTKLYNAEQYPVELRGTGTSSTEAFGRLFGGVVFAYLVPFITKTTGNAGVLWTVCILTVATTVIPVWFFGRETRGVDIDDDDLNQVIPKAS